MTLKMIEALVDHAQNAPERIAVQTVSRQRPGETRSFGQLADAAARAAGGLSGQGVRRGDIVVLVGTHHIDLYAAWLGCVWLGAVPTILAEPSVRVDRDIYGQRLSALLARIDARFVAYDPAAATDALWPATTLRSTYAELAASPAPPPLPFRDPGDDDLMLLQHSSGTTGLQKGVMLSHGAVRAHAEAYVRATAMTGQDVVASWLPLYHDMGLLACLVLPLLVGARVLWLSPFEWVSTPALLLEAIGQHGATMTWLPNFAFAFLAKSVRAPRGSFRLDTLRTVVNCSEPVTVAALHAFRDRFAGDGLSPTALHSCYAMAENVFAVTTSNVEHAPRIRAADAASWRTDHIARGPADGGPAVTHVSSGRALEGCALRIAGDDGTDLPPLHAGRILIKSPYLFGGYFRRDDLNACLFDARSFFDTGDVGYLDEDGELYVTGRRKDIVIVGGRNVYPQDVEDLANVMPGVHPGRTVCFGVTLRDLGTEGLVLLVESTLGTEERGALCRGLRAAVSSRLDLDLLDVRALDQGLLRKSTSGKIARAGNRDWYLEGRFGPPPRSVSEE